MAGRERMPHTNFESWKHDLIELRIPTDGVSRMYLPKIYPRQTGCARLQIAPKVRIIVLCGRLLGRLLSRLGLLEIGVVVLVVFFIGAVAVAVVVVHVVVESVHAEEGEGRTASRHLVLYTRGPCKSVTKSGHSFWLLTKTTMSTKHVFLFVLPEKPKKKKNLKREKKHVGQGQRGVLLGQLCRDKKEMDQPWKTMPPVSQCNEVRHNRFRLRHFKKKMQDFQERVIPMKEDILKALQLPAGQLVPEVGSWPIVFQTPESQQWLEVSRPDQTDTDPEILHLVVLIVKCMSIWCRSSAPCKQALP